MAHRRRHRTFQVTKGTVDGSSLGSAGKTNVCLVDMVFSIVTCHQRDEKAQLNTSYFAVPWAATYITAQGGPDRIFPGLNYGDTAPREDMEA